MIAAPQKCRRPSFRVTCQGTSPWDASRPPTIFMGLEKPGRRPHSAHEQGTAVVDAGGGRPTSTHSLPAALPEGWGLVAAGLLGAGEAELGVELGCCRLAALVPTVGAE